MRILLVVVYYSPSTTSAAQMMHDLATELVRQGHEVMVATPTSAIKGAIDVAVEDGVTVLRIKSGEMKKANKAIRLWRESRLSVTMWRRAREIFRNNPCDLIVFYSPTIFFGDLVRRLKMLWNCPSYLVHRDIFPQWAVDLGVFRRGGLLHRYLNYKEVAHYDAADVIGVEAPGNLLYFDKVFPRRNYRTEVLYNWISGTREAAGDSNWRKKLGLEGKVVFCYGGNIGVGQDLDNIVRLASSLGEHNDIFFLLVGSGSEVQRLNIEIERLGLKNMKIIAPLPQEQYMQCLAELDVGIVSLDKRLHSNNFTGKVLGYVSCGKPVLASVNPNNDVIDFLRRADAGVACVNGDDERLREAALLLATDPPVRERMGRNARAFCQSTFSTRAVAFQILSHFDHAEEGVTNANIS